MGAWPREAVDSAIFLRPVYAENDGSFNVYDDIRQKLIARGVPADEIKFIHEADTEAKKLELFKKVRRGDVRILMGSTQKMGAGTNVRATRL